MPQDLQRKLTTILAADAEGYSRAMGVDEARTVAALRSARGVFARFIERHGGRIANTAGDGLIAEFPSVVEAVQCAVEVQNELAAPGAAGEPLRFRIGIHLGDVIVDGTDLLGDGVNLAARLQSMAEPGGVLISRQVYEQVRAKLTVGFEYLGERRPKNLAEDVEIYRIAIGGAASGPPRAWSVLGAPAAGGVAPWGDWQSRVLRLARPYVLGAAVLLGVDLLTGPGVWAQWPILVIAVAFGWQAAPYLQRGPIQSRTIRAAVAIAALCLANLFTWDGYFWAIWPALGIVLLHILRRTRKTES